MGLPFRFKIPFVSGLYSLTVVVFKLRNLWLLYLTQKMLSFGNFEVFITLYIQNFLSFKILECSKILAFPNS